MAQPVIRHTAPLGATPPVITQPIPRHLLHHIQHRIGPVQGAGARRNARHAVEQERNMTMERPASLLTKNMSNVVACAMAQDAVAFAMAKEASKEMFQ